MTPGSPSTYQCCSQCTAKWFGHEALEACPRCGLVTQPAVLLPQTPFPFTASPKPMNADDPLSAAATLLIRIPHTQRAEVLMDALVGVPPFQRAAAKRLSRIVKQVLAAGAEDLRHECIPLVLRPRMRRSTARMIERAIATPSRETLQSLICHIQKRSRSPELQIASRVYRKTLKLLRHRNRRDRLEVDPYGWASVPSLLKLINRRSLELQLWRNWQPSDLERQERLDNGERIQLDVDGEQIRALYGHSHPDICAGNRQAPPPVLFHGTSATAAGLILRNGLHPARRTLAHLTSDFDYAEAVARKLPSPVVLKIDSTAAANAGVQFWKCNSHVWQCPVVPASFIRNFTRNGSE